MSSNILLTIDAKNEQVTLISRNKTKKYRRSINYEAIVHKFEATVHKFEVIVHKL